MNISDYQRQACRTARIDWADKHRRHIPVLGLIGELGSLATEIKKGLRDGAAYTDSHANIVEEFGDLFWYLSAVATHHRLKLAALKPPASSRRPRSSYGHVYAMVEAFAELTAVLEGAQDTEKAAIRDSLAKAYHAALVGVKRERLNLRGILSGNLRKVNGMFGAGDLGPAPCFDARFPRYERLPRRAIVHFLERKRGSSRLEVVLRSRDLNIGDRLTDNASQEDGYRFHDAFHLAYVAALGWSPVARAMFRLKRKSDPIVDEVQDGARAAIVEEAIAHLAFDYARGHSMLSGLDRIDPGLLKLIQRMVHGLEVEACSMVEWQRAIFMGLAAFRGLQRYRGGWLILDARTRSLTFRRRMRGGD